MKTFRLHLHVIAEDEVSDLLDIATDVEGVVAALVDEETATLSVVVSREAGALLVREQLLREMGAALTARA